MSNVPETPEHDPRLVAAWREHSNEQPSAHLDAAILAAAHRAVGSGPQDAARQPREATSPQRWWMPLAAAATIGAIAVGILQNVPQTPSDVAPPVSDMPAQPMAAREQAASRPEVESKFAPSPAAQSQAAPPSKASENEAQQSVARVASPPKTVESEAERAAARVATPPAAPAPSVATPQSPPASAPARSAEKAVASAMDGAAPSAAAPNPSPQPFPAERKKESDASTDTAPPPFAADTKSESKAAPRVAELARTSRAPDMAERDAMRRQNSPAPSMPAASGTVALGKSPARQDAGATSAADIDASILRIRRLHDGGKLADAAKELIALRAVTADADQRLPPELRAWAATVKQ
ncbi:MAG TPA: hypothetical protein PLW68_11515 [Casimicrobiaceae bacterium]|nr:hypothetical protein [Casimicrobiaceae bacterium]